MSKNEDRVSNSLTELGIVFEREKPIPINIYPWRNLKSKLNHKVDFYIPNNDIFIEIKGWMTIHAMSKMMWLANNLNNYYIFQMTENDWNPFLDSPLKHQNGQISKYNQQLQEILFFTKNNCQDINNITKSRIRFYIQTRINEYKLWNDEWF